VPAEQQGSGDGTVSAEAHQRMTRERDELKQKLEEATATLTDLHKSNQARDWFISQLDDPTKEVVQTASAKADLVTPHLRDVEPDKIGNVLSQDRFKPLLGSTTPPAPSGDGNGEGAPKGEESAPVESPPKPPPSGFGGPNPSGDGAPPAPDKYTLDSPEVRTLIERNDGEALKKLYDEGRIAEPARHF